MKRFNKNHYGFTLIELMIVVAILGILAAIAVSGFGSYIHNSKTSEARINLDAIRKGALAYYQTEHYIESEQAIRTRVYPESETVTGIGLEADGESIGLKTAPSVFQNTIQEKPWSQLRFSISSSIYFYYNYDAQNDDTPSFQASASASLDISCDAIFIINGDSDGAASAVLDQSNNVTLCNKATAP